MCTNVRRKLDATEPPRCQVTHSPREVRVPTSCLLPRACTCAGPRGSNRLLLERQAERRGPTHQHTCSQAQKEAPGSRGSARQGPHTDVGSQTPGTSDGGD